MLVVCYGLLPFSPLQNAAIGIALWMIVWWSTQIVPIGVTSLLPLVLFPAFGLTEIKAVASNYANPIIYLFLGGFVIGLAIEKWNIHKRLALFILRYSGEKPRQVIAGFMAATAILSMWISNTAATVMMLPIGLSVIGLLEVQFPDQAIKKRFAICLLLGLAFAANVGGTATIIGTPPNLVLAGMASESLGYEIGFGQWMLFALPLALMLFFIILVVNTRLLFRIPSFTMHGLKAMVDERLAELGRMGSAELRVAAIFACTALLWIVRAPVATLPGMDFLSDPLIAVAGAVTMFVVTDKERKPLMVWKDMRAMPWDILLLFGGGLAIAMGLSMSGTVDLIAEAMLQFSGMEWLVVILVVTALAVFLTEVMSNVALVSMLLPIAMVIAPSLGGAPLELAIPLTFGASCAFMLPIATPPNAIVFSASYIRVSDMVRAGFWLNVISVVLISLFSYFVVPLFF